ncbi:MAG: hypothetical protein HY722_16685, partial [Planctomycetes bacterium]|nr:hypothetical protein [Planctomycetota bacterium]
GTIAALVAIVLLGVGWVGLLFQVAPRLLGGEAGALAAGPPPAQPLAHGLGGLAALAGAVLLVSGRRGARSLLALSALALSAFAVWDLLRALPPARDGDLLAPFWMRLQAASPLVLGAVALAALRGGRPARAGTD